MATFFLSRLAWGSMMSWLGGAFNKGTVEPVCWLTYLLQDETPLTMRTDDPKDPENEDDVKLDGDPVRAEKVVVKILQSEVLSGFVVRDTASGVYSIVWHEMPTCLQKVLSTTGTALRWAMNKIMEAPLTHSLRMLFPVEIHMSTCDRASANGKMERLLEADRPSIPRLYGLGCQIHITHTVCGAVLDIQKSTISGAIALALAEQKCGSTRVLRASIAHVLKVCKPS